MSSRIQLLLRRIHLFSGLLLLPWVLLYGITALLFNHPRLMNPEAGPEVIAMVRSPGEPGPQIARQMADRILAEIREKVPGAGLRTEEPTASPASFTSELLATVDRPDGRLTFILDLNQGKAVLRRKAPENRALPATASPSDQHGFPVAGVAVKSGFALPEYLQEFRSFFQEQGVEPDELQIRRLPSLEFAVATESGDRTLRFVPDPASSRSAGDSPGSRGEAGSPAPAGSDSDGKATLLPDSRKPPGWRSFLLRLHTAHGYPDHLGARWIWAILVDAMFAAMVFWGLSGVVMWWQIKRTRLVGTCCLLASTLVALWLGWNMHQYFAAG